MASLQSEDGGAAEDNACSGERSRDIRNPGLLLSCSTSSDMATGMRVMAFKICLEVTYGNFAVSSQHVFVTPP